MLAEWLAYVGRPYLHMCKASQYQIPWPLGGRLLIGNTRTSLGWCFHPFKHRRRALFVAICMLPPPGLLTSIASGMRPRNPSYSKAKLICATGAPQRWGEIPSQTCTAPSIGTSRLSDNKCTGPAPLRSPTCKPRLRSMGVVRW